MCIKMLTSNWKIPFTTFFFSIFWFLSGVCYQKKKKSLSITSINAEEPKKNLSRESIISNKQNEK